MVRPSLPFGLWPLTLWFYLHRRIAAAGAGALQRRGAPAGGAVAVGGGGRGAGQQWADGAEPQPVAAARALAGDAQRVAALKLGLKLVQSRSLPPPCGRLLEVRSVQRRLLWGI